MPNERHLQPVRRKDDSEGLPARGYSWPSFQPIHGAYSESIIAARAEQVRHQLFDLAPWLADDPVYVVAVARFVRAEARAQLLGEAIATKAAEKGIIAVGARILEAATAADRLAAKLGDDLGLSPLGKAKLKAITAAGEVGEHALLELMETGRQTAAGRQLAAMDAEATDEDSDQ